MLGFSGSKPELLRIQEKNYEIGNYKPSQAQRTIKPLAAKQNRYLNKQASARERQLTDHHQDIIQR